MFRKDSGISQSFGSYHGLDLDESAPHDSHVHSQDMAIFQLDVLRAAALFQHDVHRGVALFQLGIPDDVEYFWLELMYHCNGYVQGQGGKGGFGGMRVHAIHGSLHHGSFLEGWAPVAPLGTGQALQTRIECLRLRIETAAGGLVEGLRLEDQKWGKETDSQHSRRCRVPELEQVPGDGLGQEGRDSVESQNSIEAQNLIEAS